MPDRWGPLFGRCWTPLARSLPESLMTTPRDVAFDVREIPFSMRGSWLDLSPVVALHRIADDIHLVSHVNGMHPVFALIPERDGQRVPSTWSTDPSLLEWLADDGGRIAAAFDGPQAVRLRGTGIGLRMREP